MVQGLIVDAGSADVYRRGVLDDAFFFGVAVEPDDRAQPTGNRRPRLAAILEVAGEALGSLRMSPRHDWPQSVEAADDALVPVDHRAGDDAASVGQEEHDELGDLVRLSELAHRQ